MSTTTATATQEHPVVAEKEWLAARKALLVTEKKFTRLRDQLSQQRRNLPWVKVEKDYVFDGPGGKATLADLFDGSRQLIVYHFMFGPDWDEGCSHCSFWTDHYDGALVHLRQRDTNLVLVSHAELKKLTAFKKRMGWKLKWYSSLGNDFNFDYHVSFTPEEIRSGSLFYNYAKHESDMDELPGLSTFYKDDNGDVFHTYSTYARGIDILNTTYHFLDLTALGRNENPDSPQDWVRYHDRYENHPLGS
jgi:predicted dithiol-disulfide oxidoreductase (DUF899 family)